MTPTHDDSPDAGDQNDWTVVALPQWLFYLTLAVSVPAFGFLLFVLVTD
jgi:hypothetical protein